MGDDAAYALQQEFLRGSRALHLPPVPHWPKVPCPLCGRECGGRGFTQNEGVHAHLKFKHGVRRKWRRAALIEEGPGHAS